MLRPGAAVVAMLLAAVLGLMPWLQSLEQHVLDAQFRVLRGLAPAGPAPEVVVVGIDEDTTAVLREPLTLWHPHLGRFLQAVAGAGASVVGVDIVLPDRSYESLLPGYDRSLLTGLLTARRSAPVVLALTVDSSGRTRPVYPAFVAAAGAQGTGYALLPLDSDQVVRRFDERIAWEGQSVPTLAGQMARVLGQPVQAGLIDFTAGTAFDFIPLQTVLAWAEAGDKGRLQAAFAERPVLLGSVLKYEDRLEAPVSLAAWDPQSATMPGVLLHAQVLRNLLGGGLIRPAPVWLGPLLAMAAALLWLWAPRPERAFALLPLLLAAAVAVSTFALANGMQLPVGTAMVVALVASGGRQLLQAVMERREQRRLRRAFDGYVSPPIMREILAGTLQPTLGGVEQFACLLFSDIRDYTSLSEHMTPEQTIAFLNRYFEQIVPIIHAQGGTVVSFMGDGIMAAFGAPKPLPNACESAYRVAQAMLAHRSSVRVPLPGAQTRPLEIGIGLHAGEGVAGHIGAASRHEYSVIGDVTNVASRLESVTKEVGYRLVCSRAVFDQLSDREALVPLGAHAIKGHSPVEIFGADPVLPAAAS